MTQKIRQLVKRGEWLYDGTIPSKVRVVKANFFEHRAEPDDNEPGPDYPPRDEDGNFYLVEYEIKGGRGGSVSNCFASLDEAVNEATTKRRGSIRWF